MSCSDGIGDLLARLRNAQNAMMRNVKVSFSRINMNILGVLRAEGYIADFTEIDVRKGVKEIDVFLKYHQNSPVIRSINRVSKPGRRIYYSSAEMPKFYNGLGVYILSTSKGLMIDHFARKLGIGGEVLCSVF